MQHEFPPVRNEDKVDQQNIKILSRYYRVITTTNLILWLRHLIILASLFLEIIVGSDIEVNFILDLWV